MKTALLAFNLFGLFIYQLFFGLDATIIHNPPTSLAPGESVEVSITLNKPGISGPAQLRLYLSEGLVAEKVNVEGASFTFDEEHNAAMIWLNIPSDETLELTYLLTATEDATGTQTISGKFSYLENEERLRTDIPESSITISGSVAADTPPTDVETPPDNTPATDVKADRMIKDLGDGSYEVAISLEIGNGSGFGRVKDQIPTGLTAKAKESAGASFKFESGAVTFVWLDVASSTGQLNLSYIITPNAGEYGEFIVSGAFAAEFLIAQSTQEITIPSKSILVMEPVADNTDSTDNTDNTDTTNDTTDNTDTTNDTADNTDTTNDTTNDTADNTDTTNDTADNTSDNADNSDNTDNNTSDTQTTFPPVDNNTPPVTSIPNAETGVSYRVQISAGHNSVSQDYFKDRHDYSGAINIENHEGWIKYTVGSYDEYRQARNERETIDAGYDFQGPFVTAYNDGNRITVQEALMISNQSWVK